MGDRHWTAEPRRSPLYGYPRVALIRAADPRYPENPWADAGCAYIVPVEEAEALAHALLEAVERARAGEGL